MNQTTNRTSIPKKVFYGRVTGKPDDVVRKLELLRIDKNSYHCKSSFISPDNSSELCVELSENAFDTFMAVFMLSQIEIYFAA